MVFKKVLVCIFAVAFLNGCIATSGGGFIIGPRSSSQILSETEQGQLESSGKNIEVAVPVFEPNIPKDSDKWEKEGIWPELRRAESKRFAVKMKRALEATQEFGAVRVVPDQSATGDIYVLGKIEKSNGEDVAIHIKVVGIDGKVWLSKSFKHRVKEAFFQDIRNQGKDPYDPVFEDAAAAITKKLEKQKDEYLNHLNALSEVRFGHSVSEESFAPFLEIKGSKVKLVSAPADDNAMLQRVRKLRVKDQLFIDNLQSHYEAFDAKLETPHAVWQKAAFTEAKAQRAAKKKAVVQALAGILVIAAGAAVAANSSDSSSGGDIAVIAGTTAGGLLLLESYNNRKEAKVHHEALMELGHDIDVEIAPQVIEFDKNIVDLVGNDKEQFNQWRRFLKEIYAEEAVPNIQL